MKLKSEHARIEADWNNDEESPLPKKKKLYANMNQALVDIIQLYDDYEGYTLEYLDQIVSVMC